MKTAKREQIWPYITELINHADEEFLRRADNKNKLIEELSNELFFVGAYTRADLNSQVIPLMEENAEDIYSMKELVLKKSEAKGKTTEKKKRTAKKKTAAKKKTVAKEKTAKEKTAKKRTAKKRRTKMKITC